MKPSSPGIITFGLLLPLAIAFAEPAQDIPAPVERAIANGSLTKEYEVCFRVKPFYLIGDFNGDGRADIAVLVTRHSTGKAGIAIIDAATGKVAMLGAGTVIGNGGDDFGSMDSWEIYPMDRVADGTSAPKLRGDAVLVSKSEAASALIYWNGKRFVWLQRGD